MKDFKVGLQLYTVRDLMQKDLEGTLKRVKEIGYDYVELAGPCDLSGEELKALLDKYDLKCPSAHKTLQVILEDDTLPNYLQTIGAKYCVLPWTAVENFQTDEAFQKFVADVKVASAKLKKYGIQLCYHNHDFELQTRDGIYHLDRLYDTLTPDELETEIDTCWVNYGGVDPVQYLAKFKNRATVLHLKDFECSKLNNGPVYALIDNSGRDKGGNEAKDFFEYRPVGYGRQDFKAILKVAEEVGTEYLFVEQDGHHGACSMDNAKKSRDYLKTLGL